MRHAVRFIGKLAGVRDQCGELAVQDIRFAACRRRVHHGVCPGSIADEMAKIGAMMGLGVVAVGEPRDHGRDEFQKPLGQDVLAVVQNGAIVAIGPADRFRAQGHGLVEIVHRSVRTPDLLIGLGEKAIGLLRFNNVKPADRVGHRPFPGRPVVTHSQSTDLPRSPA